MDEIVLLDDEFDDGISKEDADAIRRALLDDNENSEVGTVPSRILYEKLSPEDEEAIRRALDEEEDGNLSRMFADIPDLRPGPSGDSVTGSRKDSKGNSAKDTNELSPVDPQWETIDPNPNIQALFMEFNRAYFWGALEAVEVKWSKQMMSCAGICYYQHRAGYCHINLSLPLLKFRPRKDLVETLLHEMIHAFLFVTHNNRDHDSHGEHFHEHMFRINKQIGSNISVYHSFHDEVDHYRQHIWRCNGPCQHQRPYFGYVKRSRNRAPSANDLWWEAHRSKCNGQFIKIKEPEGFKSRKRKLDNVEQSVTVKSENTQPTLEKYGFSPNRSVNGPFIVATGGKQTDKPRTLLFNLEMKGDDARSSKNNDNGGNRNLKQLSISSTLRNSTAPKRPLPEIVILDD